MATLTFAVSVDGQEAIRASAPVHFDAAYAAAASFMSPVL